MKKVINIIIPVYNERENINYIYRELRKVEREIKHKYIFDIIFINDSSKDDSQEKIEKLSLQDKNVHFLEFSRNFGKEIATTAGIAHARGNAALMIDADAQFPPKLIPDFLEKWERGADVITGIRLKNQKEGLIKKY